VLVVPRNYGTGGTRTTGRRRDEVIFGGEDGSVNRAGRK